MNYIIIPVTNFYQNCCIIWCSITLHAAIIDPGGEHHKIIDNITKYNLSVKKILITHGHLDHIGSAYILSNIYKIPILGPHKEDDFWIKNIKFQKNIFQIPNCIFKNNHWLKNNDQIIIGNILLIVYHCPGHTPGHIVFFNKLNNILFSGDIIFKKSIGRTDFPLSNYNILIHSIKSKILVLGNHVIIIPGHGPITTVGFEISNNPFLK
ncbi:MBL fold metallo-hydrolase [Enterobacteriaceae endosymbiont of Plateumaris consimilis]|uniref:MBL fold metallo-hydrolase n=1 Tax=Enterobacteriaceae endosymbiont of Plateumaris consimilis TaxID=2675794 RepID=UPI00144968B2|nr:MBL fold metallo-hydrolase [Enterobacteriaceae endosymbiont of Plateumaris consimilis]QJC28696.1 MBL fold metallo-hydrolase [Enterobacteriaceae endosymbiont of Plateumaris consimilis]